MENRSVCDEKSICDDEYKMRQRIAMKKWVFNYVMHHGILLLDILIVVDIHRLYCNIA